MPTSDDFIEFPVFGDNSDKEKPDDPKYAAGFLPGDVLPAEWLNWFLNTISQGYNELVDNAVEFSPDSINTITNKIIAYAHNTMPGVQPTLTAGTGIDITGTTISASENLVTGQEIKTSKTFNGKPVYKKTDKFILAVTGSVTSETQITEAYSTPNLDEIITINGVMELSGYRYPLPWVRQNRFVMINYITSTTITFLYQNFPSSANINLTLTFEYTKTTD